MYRIFEIDGKFYPVEFNEEKYQVYSIGSDNPSEGGRWVAPATDSGIRYVASACDTRNAAQCKIYRQRKRDEY